MTAEDAVPNAPHPRTRSVLMGQAATAREMGEAETAGRLHHAWLIGGPAGIGKATLAYRFARHLLAAPDERIAGGDGLEVDPGSRTARQIAAASHPNLLAVERPVDDDGEMGRSISADTVRRALTFFRTTSADRGRRICIVDSVDALTAAGANALLKTVEEPPDRALILIVSHVPERVLPTIKSRCRRLSMPQLSPADVAAVLTSFDAPSIDPEAASRVASRSQGSVQRALALLDGRSLAVLDEVDQLLDRLPHVPRPRVYRLAERLADRKAHRAYVLLLERVDEWLSDRITARAAAGPRLLAPLAEVCENLREASRSAETYNLDRRPLIISMFDELADAVRRAA